MPLLQRAAPRLSIVCLSAVALGFPVAAGATDPAPSVPTADARSEGVLRGWTPVVRERGSRVTLWRGQRRGPVKGLRLTTGPRATGLAVVARQVAPRRNVTGRAVVRLKRLGVRRGATRALVTVGGGGTGIQGGVMRTRRGDLRWALWTTGPDGGRRHLAVAGARPTTTRLHRVVLRTAWGDDGRARAVLRVNGATVARSARIATGPSGASRVVIGLGRPERRSSRTVAILRSWSVRARGPVVGAADPAAAVAPSTPSPFPWSTGFESGTLGELRADMTGHSQQASVGVPPIPGNGLALRISVGGTPRDSGKWGIDLRSSFADLGLGAGAEEAYLRYRVYFSPGFDFQQGGKLPGLSGLMPGAEPGSTTAGGDYREDSFSSRVMWKQRVEGTGGGAISYMYVKQADDRSISDSTGRFVGISPRWTWGAGDGDPYAAFDEGRWNTVELYYRMNTPGVADGVHQAWLNGRPTLALDDVEYRTAAQPKLTINQLFFAVFYGGWEVAEKPHDIWIDDVAIGARRP